jgi:hypothetical protein
MTDFATEILPEEEEKAEQLLPRQEDVQEARKAIEAPAELEEKSSPAIASAGNAVLARQLGNSKELKPAAKSTSKVTSNKSKPSDPRNEKQPELTPMPDNPVPDMAAKPAPIPEKDPEPDPMLKDEAEQAQADPAFERQYRLQLLTQTLSRLLKAPENAPIDALFAAFLKATTEEQADAALAIANAVLRIDADTRRRARIVLASVMTVHKSHPLAQILAIRFGAWVSTPSAPSAPPAPPDPGGGS